jgi:hypothetical protein
VSEQHIPKDDNETNVSLRKFHEIEHPNKRHRIEFFQDHGEWRYQFTDLVKKRWRRTVVPSRFFESYAAALVDAQAASPWIAQTLTPHSWHVELLRGHVFSNSEYSEDFGDHDHCTACWKKLMPPDSASSDAEHHGYVTRYEIPDGSKQWQWHWVCSDCFKNLCLMAKSAWFLETCIARTTSDAGGGPSL